MTQPLKIVYSGDRDISVSVLRFILGKGVKPVSLLVSDDRRATHANELIELCSHLDSSRILKGDQFRHEYGMNMLKELDPDFIISVHFPYIYPKQILEIPRYGALNLHPAYLPYNRGWHTPTWAIWEGTVYGATLHFIDEGIDTGDIVHQKRITIEPGDTADTLYKRVKKLELEVFKDAWASLVNFSFTRRPQQCGSGTTHTSTDIATIQNVDPEVLVKSGDLIRLLRALTTNNIKESAFFQVDGRAYRVQLRIVEE